MGRGNRAKQVDQVILCLFPQVNCIKLDYSQFRGDLQRPEKFSALPLTDSKLCVFFKRFWFFKL